MQSVAVQANTIRQDRDERSTTIAEAVELLSGNDSEINTALDALAAVVAAIPSAATARPERYDVAFTASYTPAFANGVVHSMGVLTGNLTVNNPSDTGGFIEFLLPQDGTGGRTITLGALFQALPNSITTAANTFTWFRFIQRASDGKLICTAMLSGLSWP